MKIYDYKGRKNLCGNRVKEARARKNITQADLAARLQVAGVTMSEEQIKELLELLKKALESETVERITISIKPNKKPKQS